MLKGMIAFACVGVAPAGGLLVLQVWQEHNAAVEVATGRENEFCLGTLDAFYERLAEGAGGTPPPTTRSASASHKGRSPRQKSTPPRPDTAFDRGRCGRRWNAACRHNLVYHAGWGRGGHGTGRNSREAGRLLRSALIGPPRSTSSTRRAAT